jgi:hypothetical protein
LGRLPDLNNPKGYNDLIQWLKIYDQRKDQVAASDKIAVRQMVADITGEECLIPALYISDRVLTGEYRYPYIAKASHNSGTNHVVSGPRDIVTASKVINSSLRKPYGLNTGEWYYKHIKPGVIAETILQDNTDYKFHCSHDTVKWVQVIWDRGVKTKEAIFTPGGIVTNLHMDEKMLHTPEQRKFPGAEAWDKMTELALKLAKGWRYVRVDLYWDKKPLFGELTFHPRAGCYKSKDEKAFGEMLELDLSYKLEPIET